VVSFELAVELLDGSLERRPDILTRELQKRREPEGVGQDQLPGVDPARELRDGPNGLRLVRRERPARTIAVAGHDGPGHELCQRVGRCRPIERIAVTEVGDRAAFDEIAGKDDVRVRDRNDDVVVGVSATEEAELHRAATDVDRGPVGEDTFRRVDHDLSQVGGDVGVLSRDPRARRLARSSHERGTACMSPDLGRAKDAIAEGVVVVAVRVHDDRHREAGQLAEVFEDLATLGVRRPRVNHERRAVTQHDPDVLVVELVPAHEDAIADLGPGWHERIVPRRAGAYAAPLTSVVSHTTTADGTELLVRHWLPEEASAGDAWAGRPWAHVLLVHGLSDHSGRFEHVGEQFAAAGLDTWAFDLRGNGDSGGRRGHVERWGQLHDDLAERLMAARRVAGDRPVVLHGHSMGSLIVLGYLLSDQPKPDLVVAGSPALDSTLATWRKLLARVLGRVAPTLPIPNGIDGGTLSRDPAVGAKAAADPDCCKTSTARFGAEGLAEQARVRREYRGLTTLPMLVLHGLDDGLVPPAASEILATLPNVERRTYPGLRHELHNEPEGPAIIDEVIAWLRERATIAAQPNTASGERLAR
jgi:acylglycerol lipase